MGPDLSRGRVLVTGGLGFVGRYVCRQLSRAGAEVIATELPGSRLDDLDQPTIPVDLEDSKAVDQVIRGFDLVVHLAARAGGIAFQDDAGSDTYKVNRAITDNVVRASLRSGVRRVFLASSAVVYRPSPQPLDEGAPTLSVSDGPSQYAWSKITDEVVAAWHGDLDTVVGRFGNVFGPGAPVDSRSTTVVHALIDRALGLKPGEELEVWGDGSAVRSFIYVADVARAILAILEGAPAGSTVNVDSGEPISIKALAELIRDEAAPGASLRFDPAKPSGPARRVPDVTLLRGLGFTAATDLREGVRLTVAEMRQRRLESG